MKEEDSEGRALNIYLRTYRYNEEEDEFELLSRAGKKKLSKLVQDSQ